MDLLDDGPQKTALREAFPILVFKHAGWRLGVAVDQVEAIINLPPLPATGEPAVCEYLGQAIPMYALGAWLGLEEDAGWQPSRVLIAHALADPAGCGDALRAFLVDAPSNILTLPLEAVYAMPVLLARALGRSPFWGFGHDQHVDGLILLVDLGADAARGADAVPGAGPGSRGGGELRL
ncbi:MAG: chemotaxis protein CheW [Anaerolineae bacterium]|nr:chemotaxis protein CheW [Anaerolineae bacterium]